MTIQTVHVLIHESEKQDVFVQVLRHREDACAAAKEIVEGIWSSYEDEDWPDMPDDYEEAIELLRDLSGTWDDIRIEELAICERKEEVDG